MDKDNNLVMRFVKYLALINIVLLLYTAFIKYSPYSSDCFSCHNQLFMPMTEVAIALTGALASLSIFLLIVFWYRSKYVAHITIGFTALCAVFATFLQVIQFTVKTNGICYYCFIAASIFYLIFIIILFQSIINKKIFTTNYNATFK
ncbi:hypothetical protein SAMN02745221_02169 [Thermosyntropha lipolytica DSM 11003]|uniref:Vitamin K epoxide reductase family protein n=1 Tax=Thermosyntropha lipolytica DSM 11003 TaxID=1123382 RepID=A0A1M5S508_9FIRM|nr:hypothetical protein [Thermosyntropha lipolytica]SHH33520.1 hypothetical protein SAMN02745221_02169 [Thermosyntropha lipolytica DSM 11003]